MFKSTFMICLVATTQIHATETINYSRDIRPLLSKHCFACHGPEEDHREADLRMDLESSAKENHDGIAAIVTGQAEQSEAYLRMITDDQDDKMPPPEHGKFMKSEEIALIKHWIDNGAEYSRHWAFEALESRPSLQSSEIDQHVLEAARKKGLEPRSKADERTLLRRLSLDLTGLPPNFEDLQIYLNDDGPNRYENAVNRLLASPHYGEKWAWLWLDLARYADSQGYEKDLSRKIWPYRDWVIKAFNQDMPFDQFTIEQLAGDLLPNPSRDQILATAFHRNTMTNTENGTDNEEFRIQAVKDRVDTTGLVWLGLNVGCAKCHTHKYDPITIDEYYEMFAIFNQSEDNDLKSDEPLLMMANPKQKERIHATRAQIDQLSKELIQAKAEKRAKEIFAKQRALSRAKQRLMSSEREAGIPIMRELPVSKQRVTNLHERGNFLNLGKVVQPGVFKAFHKPQKPEVKNRLELAEWLLQKDNPLTARVTVNRVWASLFGRGLVSSLGDFGLQGGYPTHPELLDGLAWTFIQEGWSFKKLIKLIVMSETYQRDSNSFPEQLEKDPNNHYLSRGPRVRLDAEAIRDQALMLSGLLSRKLYGPPVMPPQPEGIWASVYNSGTWQTSTGEDRHRRALYTFLKRTAPYPSMMIFDATSRESCTVERVQTNTPLQSFVTLNDPVYVEASMAMGEQLALWRKQEKSNIKVVARAFEYATLRPPHADELSSLMELFELAYEHFSCDPKSLQAYLEQYELPKRHEVKDLDWASYSILSSAILNLDEIFIKG